MAKSMRSKWKRKMRAVKRTKNSVRELVKLKHLADLDKAGQADFSMGDLVTMSDGSKFKDVKQSKNVDDAAPVEGEMEIDSKFNRKTLRDENGQYPSWMNQKQMQKRKSKNKIKKKVQTKKITKKRK